MSGIAAWKLTLEARKAEGLACLFEQAKVWKVQVYIET